MLINSFEKNNSKLSLKVKKRFNEKMGKMLSYLSSDDIVKTGRVENYTLCDEINLYYPIVRPLYLVLSHLIVGASKA